MSSLYWIRALKALTVFTKHNSYTGMLCAKSSNGWINGINVMDKRDFSRVESDTDFGRICLIATFPRSMISEIACDTRHILLYPKARNRNRTVIRRWCQHEPSGTQFGEISIKIQLRPVRNWNYIWKYQPFCSCDIRNPCADSTGEYLPDVIINPLRPVVPFINRFLTKIMSWLGDFISNLMLDVITHPCPISNDWSYRGFVFTPHPFIWM